MPPWRSISRPQLIAASAVFVLLAAVGFLPLFGGPGYEQALASGLIVPAAAAIATAIELSASDFAPFAGVARGIGSGIALALIAFSTALLHGLRVGICDFSGGAVFYALTAGFGAIVGGTWGAVVAEVCRGRPRARRTWCVLLGLAGPIGGIVVSVARFWGSPMIFAYDPFFGFFSGTLYDTIVDVRTELWTYRAGSLATVVGVALIASVFTRTTARTLALRADWPAALRAFLGLAALSGSLAITANGPELGHWQTAASIARSLGGRASGPHCDVVFPDSLLAEQVTLLVRDCEEELSADEKRLGASLGGRLTDYVFRDGNEKRRLMGAAQTSIAKPWRREVYVQLSGYPHPILGHEIAHAVAGSFGSGPFRIAGGAGGLWPNPGLIEGVAVATSPDDEELTDAQWARAMLDLGILPPVRLLFSFGFLGENAAKSYTIAGAFVTWVLDRWGAPVVRAWYGGASIEELSGQGWGALDDQFRQSLRSLPMPADALAYARARFERPSVWVRKCPHVVDALNRDGDRCRDDHRLARAIESYDGVIARDPSDLHARFELARIDVWSGDHTRGRDELAKIGADGQTPKTWRDHAQELLADDDMARGLYERAAEAYRAIAAHTLDEDVARTLEVKAQAASDPAARRAIVDLLIGTPGRPVDSWLGALSLGTWAEQAHEPLADYLIGKNLALHAEYARAASWLDSALDAGASTPSVGRELLRQRAICACALGDSGPLERVKERVQAEASPFAKSAGGGRKQSVLALVARCAETSPPHLPSR
jgi:hypothetical protein